MKKMLFIVNPYAGRAQPQRFVFDATKIFTEAGYLVTVYPMQGRGSGKELILSHQGEFDVVTCCGGDGTLNETINGVMQCEKRVPIGYLPVGTTNDLASSLNIPSNPIKAAQKIVESEAFQYDVGSFNDRYYSYIAAFGAFTETSYSTPQQLKNTIGHLAYILEGIKSMPSIKPIYARITTDEAVFEDEFIFGGVTNSLSVGGLVKLKSDDVKLNDGLFEMILVRNPDTPADLQQIITSVLKHEFDGPYMKLVKTKKVLFESNEPVGWTLDGEDGGKVTRAELINHQKAIDILI